MRRAVKVIGLVALVAGCGAGEEGPYTVTGTARLPSCDEAPATDLSGTWFDNGTLTITSTGCEADDAPNGSTHMVCALQWVMTQSGNDVAIVVDNEYELKGRICGSTLHLEGGWWLPLADDGMCNYDDDDGAEVGIQSEGASLTWSIDAQSTAESMTGTLVVREKCTGEYAVEFSRL